MKDKTHDVFISYARQDQKSVDALIAELQSAGIKVWTDNEIEAGDRWAEEIREAIESSRCILLYISENSLNSEWANFEAGVALSRIRGGDDIKVLPAVAPGIEQSRLPYRFRELPIVDSQNTAQLISQIRV